MKLVRSGLPNGLAQELTEKSEQLVIVGRRDDAARPSPHLSRNFPRTTSLPHERSLI